MMIDDGGVVKIVYGALLLMLPEVLVMLTKDIC